ncbi:MAG TPA: M1 family metallopeptidase [Rubricoccaceae bacterium]
MRPLLVLVAIVALTAPARAQFGAGPNASGGPLRPEQAAFDVGYVRLDVAVRPATRTIEGTMAMTARIVSPTDRLLLDLDSALVVRTVTGEGGALLVERTPQALLVHLGRTAQPGETVRLSVAYGGAPREAARPPWDGGFTWTTTPDGQPWVAVSCQGEGADLWWPAKDHPSDEPDSVRVALTVPAALRGVSTGRWEGRVENGDGTATETWFVSNPINNYGVSFGVGPYTPVETTYTSPLGGALAYTMPVTFWVLPERVADARRQLPGFLDAVAFNERTFGPYAWRADGYKVLQTPYLGMEHQSLVAYGDEFQDNAYGFDWLHDHEMTHEWWANLGTAADWNDFWIHESFATYAEALYAEDIAVRNGGDADSTYLAYVNATRGRVVNEIPVAPRESRTTKQMYTLPGGGFNGDIYFKGAQVLHTLRYVMDDDAAFVGAMRRILYPTPEAERVSDGRQARFLTTADVEAAFSEASGLDLATFWEVYLRQPYLPVLEVERTAPGATLRWALPGDLDATRFEVPVEVSVDGARRRVEMPGGVGHVGVPVGAAFEVDPDGRVLFVVAP